MAEKVAELEKDLEAGKPGAKKRLKSFRVERILLVDSIVQVRFSSAVSSWVWFDLPNRAVPNLSNGPRWKNKLRLMSQKKEEPKGMKREYHQKSGSLVFVCANLIPSQVESPHTGCGV
jgi:hypothetical protein